ncbi:Uncharacterised protein [Mycobacteroides abscessus]|nr:Uncharacterised protein [Mycobacteroides abscessus]
MFQCIFIADLFGFIQIIQRLIEGLHAQFTGTLHQILDFMHITFTNQVGNQW